ncbi:MAG: hypothetical protein J6U56_06090 [Spirochaetia bacterium]|nr:hypothetical protein [Spirochaetia bacterium]
MKAIKFNLQYGDKQIKSLAELKEYGNIDMLLETLNNGMLERWLEAHGYKELEEVKKIDKSNARKACDALCTIFFDADATTAQKAAAELFKIRKEEEKRLESLKGLKEQEKKIINNYHDGYNNIISSFRNNANDYAVLKAGMVELDEKYRDLLILDKENFYSSFKKHSLVLLALMANKQLRDFIGYEEKNVYQDIMNMIKPTKIIYNDYELTTSEWEVVFRLIDSKKGKPKDILEKLIYHLKPFSYTAEFINDENSLQLFRSRHGSKETACYFKDNGYTLRRCYTASEAEKMGFYIFKETVIPQPPLAYIKYYSGSTLEEIWDDIEPDTQKVFMIISMTKDCLLRSVGNAGEKLTADDVNEHFIFTNGIEFKSGKSDAQLIYMEI